MLCEMRVVRGRIDSTIPIRQRWVGVLLEAIGIPNEDSNIGSERERERYREHVVKKSMEKQTRHAHTYIYAMDKEILRHKESK